MKKTSRPSRTARCAVSPVRVASALTELAADADQHPAPVVFTRQPPDGGPEHIVLPSVGIGEEAAALQRIGQTEDAARVDAEDLGQSGQRHRLGRPPLQATRVRGRAASPPLPPGALPPPLCTSLLLPFALRLQATSHAARNWVCFIVLGIVLIDFISPAVRAARSAPWPPCSCSSASP